MGVLRASGKRGRTCPPALAGVQPRAGHSRLLHASRRPVSLLPPHNKSSATNNKKKCSILLLFSVFYR